MSQKEIVIHLAILFLFGAGFGIALDRLAILIVSKVRVVIIMRQVRKRLNIKHHCHRCRRRK